MSDNSPKAILSAHGLTAKRAFGQNFLADPGIARRIAEAAVPEGTALALEIGAGVGALTTPLLQRARRVVAIERDRDLVPILRTLHATAIEEGRLEILQADAKTLDYAAWLLPQAASNVLLGNLPYHLTGPLLRRAVELAELVGQAVFLVQLEVGARLLAEPGSSEYGALTVFVQARYEVDRLLVVRSGAFYPSPKVDSALIRLRPHPEPRAKESELFRELVHRAFQQRRKTLRNAWADLSPGAPQALQQAAQRAGIALDLRGESLSPEQFARMAKELFCS